MKYEIKSKDDPEYSFMDALRDGNYEYLDATKDAPDRPLVDGPRMTVSDYCNLTHDWWRWEDLHELKTFCSADCDYLDKLPLGAYNIYRRKARKLQESLHSHPVKAYVEFVKQGANFRNQYFTFRMALNGIINEIQKYMDYHYSHLSSECKKSADGITVIDNVRFALGDKNELFVDLNPDPEVNKD